MASRENGSPPVLKRVRKQRFGSGAWMELSLQEVLSILLLQVPPLFAVLELLALYLALSLPLTACLPRYSPYTPHIRKCMWVVSLHSHGSFTVYFSLFVLCYTLSCAILCSFLRHLSPFEAGSSCLHGFRSAPQAPPRETSWQ